MGCARAIATSRESGQAGIPGHESLLFIAAPGLPGMTFHFYDISLFRSDDLWLFLRSKTSLFDAIHSLKFDTI